MPKSALRLLPLLLAAASLSGCLVGPDFLRPEVPVPAAYGEAPAGWKDAEPQDQQPPGDWWQVYGDAQLDQLVAAADQANQDIFVAAAQYRQAQAQLAGIRATLFPTIDADLASTRAQSATSSGSTTAARTTDKLSASGSWELDLWGRIRRSVEASRGSAEASAADLAAARLTVQATLVQDYLQLRLNDAQQRLYAETLVAYQRTLEITRNRYEAGVAGQADVAQAGAQLKSTQAAATDLGIERAQLEHAIAILLGQPPAAFRIAPTQVLPTLPELPVVVPSTLLERRPDIAAAERRVASANARIGVARAAYFPSITLAASGGYQNNTFADLISLPNRFWSVGPALALTLFDGGARAAASDEAVGAYDEAVASYRQTVLSGFQEVEDNLASLRILAREAGEREAALRAARQYLELTNNQYLAGTVSFLDVATAQATALSAERSLLDVRLRQLTASVALRKALGGADWREAAAAAADLGRSDGQGQAAAMASAGPMGADAARVPSSAADTTTSAASAASSTAAGGAAASGR
jgi:NodT family efflux transporter outer membrane factor (OMF) lipoprotein